MIKVDAQNGVVQAALRPPLSGVDRPGSVQPVGALGAVVAVDALHVFGIEAGADGAGVGYLGSPLCPACLDIHYYYVELVGYFIGDSVEELSWLRPLILCPVATDLLKHFPLGYRHFLGSVLV